MNTKENDIWDAGVHSSNQVTLKSGWGKRQTYAVEGHKTKDGVFPPRYKFLVEALSGPYAGQTMEAEDVEGDLRVSNTVLYNALPQQMQQYLVNVTSAATVAMNAGWNAAAPYFFDKGVEAERTRSEEEQQARREQRRQLGEEIRAEAKETGRDPADVAMDRVHGSRLEREARARTQPDAAEKSWEARCAKGEHGEECGHQR